MLESSGVATESVPVQLFVPIRAVTLVDFRAAVSSEP